MPSVAAMIIFAMLTRLLQQWPFIQYPVRGVGGGADGQDYRLRQDVLVLF